MSKYHDEFDLLVPLIDAISARQKAIGVLSMRITGQTGTEISASDKLGLASPNPDKPDPKPKSWTKTFQLQARYEAKNIVSSSRKISLVSDYLLLQRNKMLL